MADPKDDPQAPPNPAPTASEAKTEQLPAQTPATAETKTEPFAVATDARPEPLAILPGALPAPAPAPAPVAAAAPPPAPAPAPVPGPVPVAVPTAVARPAAPIRQAYEEPEEDDYAATRPHPSRAGLIAVLLGGLLGTTFASVSTNDFMQHLDRQVHAIHCSFIPGAGREMGESGCKAVMMSPYSSFFRESVWGGVPVSLCALAVFAYLFYRAALLLWRGKPARAETSFLVAATLLPVLMTVIFAFISVSKVGATCKVCIGIYASSALVFIGALMAHLNNNSGFDPAPVGSRYALWFGEGVAFVGVLTVVYLMASPSSDPKNLLTGCGSLVNADDPNGVMIPLVSGDGEAAIEVLDPLCPSCKAFDTRLNASGLRDRLALKGVLFPLDNACNWMVTEAVHPGACAVSEALLCVAGLNGSKDEAATHDLLRWAFAHQEELRTLAAKDDAAVRSKIENAFPKVKGCLGTPLVKSKLTKSLRWAVANAIPVLTPQLFVGNARMCDEDTDLGLEYTLSKLMSQKSQKARSSSVPPRPAPKKSEATP